MSEVILETQGLSKEFKGFAAVNEAAELVRPYVEARRDTARYKRPLSGQARSGTMRFESEH